MYTEWGGNKSITQTYVYVKCMWNNEIVAMNATQLSAILQSHTFLDLVI
jgi:hypothetical protein